MQCNIHVRQLASTTPYRVSVQVWESSHPGELQLDSMQLLDAQSQTSLLKQATFRCRDAVSLGLRSIRIYAHYECS